MSESTTPTTDPTHGALNVMSHDTIVLAGVALASTAMLTMVSPIVGVLLLASSGLGTLIRRLNVALKSATA